MTREVVDLQTKASCCVYLQFKEEYSTEKKIAAALAPRPDSPDWLKKELDDTKKGLFKLMSVRAVNNSPGLPSFRSLMASLLVRDFLAMRGVDYYPLCDLQTFAWVLKSASRAA